MSLGETQCVRFASTVGTFALGLLCFRFSTVCFYDAETDICASASTARLRLRGIEVFPAICCSFVFLLLACTKPKPTPSSLDVANIALSVTWVWQYCTMFADFYDYNAPLIWAFRIIQGVVLGNFRLTFRRPTSLPHSLGF